MGAEQLFVILQAMKVVEKLVLAPSNLTKEQYLEIFRSEADIADKRWEEAKDLIRDDG